MKKPEYYVILQCAKCKQSYAMWTFSVFKKRMRKEVEKNGKPYALTQYCCDCSENTRHRITGLRKIQDIAFSWRDK